MNWSSGFLRGVLFSFLLLLGACSNPVSDALSSLLSPSGNDSSRTGSLTISNASSYDIDFVYWVSDDGTKYYYTPDQVFDSVLNKTVGGMYSGSSKSLTVKKGNSAVYFFFTDGGVQQCTESTIKVDADANQAFSLTDSTPTMSLSARMLRVE